MTPRQKETLDFIRGYWEDNEYAPSYEEIREGISAKSKSSVASLIKKLEERDYIERIPNAARSIRLKIALKVIDPPASREDLPYG